MAGPVQTAPNQVYLAGPFVRMNETDAFTSLGTASAAITPGTCIEPHDDAGDKKLRPVADPTLLHEMLVAINLLAFNKSVDDPYAIGDQVHYHFAHPGYLAWMVVEGVQGVIANQEILMVGAGGTLLKTGALNTATANRARWRAEESVDTAGGDIRCRVTLISA